MLILSRHKDESLVIDGNIEIIVVDIKGDQVKIGIEAPRDVKIFRKEVFLAIQNQNREAASSPNTEIPQIDFP